VTVRKHTPCITMDSCTVQLGKLPLVLPVPAKKIKYPRGGAKPRESKAEASGEAEEGEAQAGVGEGVEGEGKGAGRGLTMAR